MVELAPMGEGDPAMMLDLASIIRKCPSNVGGANGPDMAAPTGAAKRQHKSDDVSSEDSGPKRIKTEPDVEAEALACSWSDAAAAAALEAQMPELVNNALRSLGGFSEPYPERRVEATAGNKVGDDVGNDVESLLEFASPLRHAQITTIEGTAAIALQLLLLLYVYSEKGTFASLQDERSEATVTYRALKTILDSSIRLYNPTGRILHPDELCMGNESYLQPIRFVNLAIISTSVLIPNEPDPPPDADNDFLAAFLADGQELTPEVSALYVELNGRNAVARLRQSGLPLLSSRLDLIESATVVGLEAMLRERHPDFELHPADMDLLTRMEASKEALTRELCQDTDLGSRQDEYHRAALLRFADWLDSESATLMVEGAKYNVTLPPIKDDESSEREEGSGGSRGGSIQKEERHADGEDYNKVENGGAGPAADMQPSIETDYELLLQHEQNQDQDQDQDPYQEREQDELGGGSGLHKYNDLKALIEMNTKHYVENTLNRLCHGSAQSYMPPQVPQPTQATARYLSQAAPTPTPTPGPGSGLTPAAPPGPGPGIQGFDTPAGALPPNQSSPTSVLYDKARQATLSKSSTQTRREGNSSSTRRPWSQEEEEALMAGLDMAEGPHWSQILTMFGRNGKVSSILKGRSQVQLKDKARNLKLFFLKSGCEMPYYLQAVTGELKTRAPSQAARREAEERLRMINSDGEQGQAIIALGGGGGLQSHGAAGPDVGAAAVAAAVVATGPIPTMAAGELSPAAGVSGARINPTANPTSLVTHVSQAPTQLMPPYSVPTNGTPTPPLKQEQEQEQQEQQQHREQQQEEQQGRRRHQSIPATAETTVGHPFVFTPIPPPVRAASTGDLSRPGVIQSLAHVDPSQPYKRSGDDQDEALLQTLREAE